MHIVYQTLDSGQKVDTIADTEQHWFKLSKMGFSELVHMHMFITGEQITIDQTLSFRAQS